MTHRICLIVAALFALVAGLACRSQDSPEAPTAAPAASVSLPEPTLTGGLALEAAIARRRSVRTFTNEALTEAELGQLAWAGQGITDAISGHRAAPSAGALYPIELYVVTAEGVRRYLPGEHAFELAPEGDRRAALQAASLNQESITDAPAVVVIAGVYARTAGKYGDRAERYVHMEAGCVAQNVLLEATSLGLGAVPIGAFEDAEVSRALGLPADHAPLLLIPVGRSD